VASKGADGWRSTSGGGVRDSGKMKGRRGIAFSPHVEASAEERAAGKAATAKIDVGGRNSKTAATGSVGGTRDPEDMNRRTSKPPMRRRSEEGELGSFTDGEGARAAAMARRLVLQSVTRRAREREGVGAWVCAKGVWRCPGGAYIGSGEEGKGLPVAMAINGHAALMGNQEGGLRSGNCRLMAGK
jgi:hypothetical protein